MSLLSFLANNLRFLIFNTSGFIFVFIMLYRTAGIRFRLSVTLYVYVLLWVFRCFGVTMFIVNYLGNRYGEELWYNILLCTVNILVSVLGVVYIRILFQGSLSKNLLLFIGTEIALTVWMRIFAYGLSLIWPSYDYQLMLNHFEIQDLLLLVFFGLLIWLLARYGHPFFEVYRRWEPAHPVLLNTVIVCYLIFGNLTSVALALNDSFERQGFMVFYAMMVIILVVYYWVDFYHIIRLRESARHRELLYQEKSLLAYYEESLKQTSRINQYQSEIKDMMEKLSRKADQGESDSRERTCSLPSGEKDDMRQSVRSYLDELKDRQSTLSVVKYCSDYTLDQFLSYKEQLLLDAGYRTTMHFQDYYTPPGILVTDVIEILHWMTTGILPELDISTLQDRIILSASSDENSTRREGPIKGRMVMAGAVIGRMLVLHCEAEGEKVKAPLLRHIRHVRKRNRLEIDLSEGHGKMRVLAGIPF